MDTRKVLKNRLELACVAGPAAELVLAATAADRHAWRVKETERISTEWASESWQLVVALDFVGHGGPMGLGGPTGRSHRFLHALGSGRWRANDGDAWRAAARQALEISTDVEDDVEWVVSHFSLGSTGISWREGPAISIASLLGIGLAPWLLAVAGRWLLVAPLAGCAMMWAEAYNQAYAATHTGPR
jgi:hypothetical protein